MHVPQMGQEAPRSIAVQTQETPVLGKQPALPALRFLEARLLKHLKCKLALRATFRTGIMT